jgi:uncharacterized repeat protein (TIGR01451 family)
MIGKACKSLAMGALLLWSVQPAAAQGTGSLTSKIELEKSTPSPGGAPATKTYTEPKVVVPGDRIRVALTFTNNAANPAAGVKLVNPIPEGLVFDDTANAEYFTVSTDGGNSFGALASLTVPVQGASPRAATAADVTHVRWLWPDAIAPGQSRSVAFFGRVR